jgi:hypothetical protein
VKRGQLSFEIDLTSNVSTITRNGCRWVYTPKPDVDPLMARLPRRAV